MARAVAFLAVAAVCLEARAQEPERVVETAAIRAQATFNLQGYPRFSAPPDGPLSLPRGGQARQSTSLTAFLSFRLPWEGGELHVNPEYFQGFGVNQTQGIAGFVNGDAQKTGTRGGTLYLARGYLRQTFALTGEREWQAGGPNQLAGWVPTRRITVLVGRFAAIDFFQNSAYAGDPRRQFQNWSFWGPGAWDFAANSRGYVDGLMVEGTLGPGLMLRYGAMLMPTTLNGNNLAPRPNNVNHVVELDWRHRLFGRPGAIRPFGFYTTGRMGRFDDALAISAGLGIDPNAAIATTRRFGNVKWGFGVLVDQEIADDVGLFARATWADGRTENFAFTQIDRSLAAGLSFKGELWGRAGHTAGIAAAWNELSPNQRRFLAAGGVGLIIGDGSLRYAPERIIEAYYDLPVFRENLFLAANYQFVQNPGYNADRGPAHVFGMRLHARY